MLECFSGVRLSLFAYGYVCILCYISCGFVVSTVRLGFSMIWG